MLQLQLPGDEDSWIGCCFMFSVSSDTLGTVELMNCLRSDPWRVNWHKEGQLHRLYPVLPASFIHLEVLPQTICPNLSEPRAAGKEYLLLRLDTCPLIFLNSSFFHYNFGLPSRSRISIIKMYETHQNGPHQKV